MNLLPLLTAFGLGSIITVLIQAALAQLAQKSGRSFEERKAAYIGLLEAYQRAAVEGTDAAGKEFAYWQMRCDLVAPDDVRAAISRIVETNDDWDGRGVAHENLKLALRTDLGIARKRRVGAA